MIPCKVYLSIIDEEYLIIFNYCFRSINKFGLKSLFSIARKIISSIPIIYRREQPLHSMGTPKIRLLYLSNKIKNKSSCL